MFGLLTFRIEITTKVQDFFVALFCCDAPNMHEYHKLFNNNDSNFTRLIHLKKQKQVSKMLSSCCYKVSLIALESTLFSY